MAQGIRDRAPEVQGAVVRALGLDLYGVDLAEASEAHHVGYYEAVAGDVTEEMLAEVVALRIWAHRKRPGVGRPEEGWPILSQFTEADFRGLSNVTLLDLSFNRLQTPGFGFFETVLKTMPDLAVVLLQGNDLVSLPEELGRFKNLRLVDASFNSIEQPPNFVRQTPSLRLLDLSHNKIKEIPLWLAQNPAAMAKIRLEGDKAPPGAGGRGGAAFRRSPGCAASALWILAPALSPPDGPPTDGRAGA